MPRESPSNEDEVRTVNKQWKRDKTDDVTMDVRGLFKQIHFQIGICFRVEV